jgi:hypothetical protein
MLKPVTLYNRLNDVYKLIKLEGLHMNQQPGLTIECAICGKTERVDETTSIDGIAPDWFIFNEMICDYVCSLECDIIADKQFDFGDGFHIEEIIYEEVI